jgi:hypothetical protein
LYAEGEKAINVNVYVITFYSYEEEGVFAGIALGEAGIKQSDIFFTEIQAPVCSLETIFAIKDAEFSQLGVSYEDFEDALNEFYDEHNELTSSNAVIDIDGVEVKLNIIELNVNESF